MKYLKDTANAPFGGMTAMDQTKKTMLLEGC